MKKKSSTKDLSLSSNEKLFFKSKSLFRPKNYLNLKPKDFNIFTFHAGFKNKTDDLLIIIFNKTVNSLNFYSRTSTPSAPIIWDKKNNKGKVRALIVNSGNANAHTGSNGLKIIDSYVNFLSKKIGCNKNEILVSSTGVIGEIFDPKLIINKIEKIKITKKTDIISAAKSIMTTDTYPKTSLIKSKINNKKFKIYGFAKGSGMIMPNMGTMLVYIFIEVDIPNMILKKIVKDNLDITFNSITADSDTSTSDTLIFFNLNKVKINLNKKNIDLINNSIHKIMSDLSLKVIKDGEGLSKLIKVKTINSKTLIQAKNISFSIANSPLVKTAIAGQDANWGRIIMAIGKSKEKINQNKIKIFFGKNLVCYNGSINSNLNLENLNKYMKNDTIEITVDLNIGSKNFTVYGNDLTHDYIKINADYRS